MPLKGRIWSRRLTVDGNNHNQVHSLRASKVTTPASERSRVLFIAKKVVGGGAERVVTILMRHVNRAAFEPHLLTISIDAYRGDIPEDVIIHKLRASELRWAMPQLVSMVRRIRPHVILSTLTETNVAVLLVRPFFPSGTKVIVREALNPSDMLDHLLPVPFLWRQAYRRLYPRADAIVCQSDAMQADVLRHVPVEPAKAPRIYNGVDAALIERLAAGSSPYPTRGPNLLAAGRLSPQKDFPLLLDAFARVRSSFATARLTILGSGPEEARLKNRARELRIDDAVEFAGFQQNPFPFYRHADLYLQTSIYEGLPNVLLEVLSVGTPAVATAEGGATAEIARFVESVRLVAEPGVQPYANAVIEALQRPIPPLRRDRFLQVFGVEHMTMEYENLFANVIGRATSPHRAGATTAAPQSSR